MAKRPAPDSASDHQRDFSSPNKRRHGEQVKGSQNPTSALANIKALSDLLGSADELIECLQELKRSEDSILNQDSHNQSLIAIQQRLCTVSQGVVPQLQAFGQNSDKITQSNTFSQSSTPLSRSESPGTSPLHVEAWHSSDIARQLPPLPPIKDSKLESTTFTHKGIDSYNHYERLEWVGDAYMEMIATVLIEKTFQRLPSGRLSQMRERLIRNTQLAEYFREYGLHSRARLPADLANRADPGRGSSKDKDLQKTQGDMFEAYVAAVIQSDPVNGLDAAVKWLKALWARTLQEDIQKAESKNGAQPDLSGHGSQRPTTKTPKEELSTQIVVKGIVIHYESMPCSKKDKHHNLPMFAVGAYLDGWGETHKLLGVGTALSVKEAGHKAATAALQNKKLLSQYTAKKASFMAARAAGEQNSG